MDQSHRRRGNAIRTHTLLVLGLLVGLVGALLAVPVGAGTFNMVKIVHQPAPVTLDGEPYPVVATIASTCANVPVVQACDRIRLELSYVVTDENGQPQVRTVSRSVFPLYQVFVFTHIIPAEEITEPVLRYRLEVRQSLDTYLYSEPSNGEPIPLHPHRYSVSDRSPSSGYHEVPVEPRPGVLP